MMQLFRSNLKEGQCKVIAILPQRASAKER
jgi:hypothetical protein